MALVACRPDTVALDYEFPEGSTARYMLTAEAESSWDIGGPGAGSYRVTFEVEETVESVSEDEAVVDVSMIPVDVEENGLPSPGAQARAFTLRVARSGDVLEVIEVDGLSASELEPDQVIFIGTYRPPLPADPARLGDRWTATAATGISGGFQQILAGGLLRGLNEDPEGRHAEIEYEGQNPLVWTTQLPQGSAELTGAASTHASATFDIDGGYLRAAESTTSGDFDVRVVERDQVPINGLLHLDLTLTVERLSD